MNRLDHLWAESIQKELDDGRLAYGHRATHLRRSQSTLSPRFAWVSAIAEFRSDVRANPSLALICTIGGFALGLLSIAVPAIIVVRMS
jgi:hypothetical protein